MEGEFASTTCFKYTHYYTLYTDFRIEDILVSGTANLSPVEGTFAEIAIPINEVLEDVQIGTKVRVASFLFRNMSGLLPRRMEGAEDDGTRRSVGWKKSIIMIEWLTGSWLDDARDFPTC